MGLDNADNPQPPSRSTAPSSSTASSPSTALGSARSKRSTADRCEFGVVLFALVLPTLITWLYFVVLATASPSTQLLGYGTKVFQVVLPWLWVVVIRRDQSFRRSHPTYDGLTFGFAFGLAIGLSMLLLYFGWLKSSSWLGNGLDEIREKVLGLGVNTVWKYALMGVFYSLIHSLFEEYYWRWFVFGRMRRWSSVGTAVAISSLGFMAHHVLVLGFFFGWTNPLTYFLSLSVAVGGAVWAVLYHRTDNLLATWVSHLMIDAAIFAVGFDVVRTQLV